MRLIRIFSVPATDVLQSPSLDKKRDKAVKVLISFSRKLTIRRLDSRIACLRPYGADSLGKDGVRLRHASVAFELRGAGSPGLVDFAGGRGSDKTALPPGQGLKASEKHKNDNNEQRETNAASGDITPVSAVRPAR